MDIAFFGSSLVSSYWNGAATYYRGIIRALHARGYRITFYEPDAYDRQKHRDIEDPPWARVVVYPAKSSSGVYRVLDEASNAGLIVKASGVGVFDEFLEREIANLRAPSRRVAFWDVDAPATLERVQANPADPFAALIPKYDLIFTYGGGPPVVNAYKALGARECVPIYNGLDSSTHFPVAPEPRFESDLSFLGNRLPDREARVDEFFLRPAAARPSRRFLLGGAGWGDKARSGNVTWIDHVSTSDHNAFNCSAQAVLNISRESMARFGYSPATRVFEAAGAAACILTDYWEGIDQFFEPGAEILVARDGDEVLQILDTLNSRRAAVIGRAAYRRATAHHTYAGRAAQVEAALQGSVRRAAS